MDAVIGGVVGGFVLVIGALFKLFTMIGDIRESMGKIVGELKTHKEVHEVERRQRLQSSGHMEQGSDWRLTEKGQSLIPTQLKEDIDRLIERLPDRRRFGIKIGGSKRIEAANFGLISGDAIKELGGVERLLDDAEAAGVDLEDFMIIVETYILNHISHMK